MKLSPPTDAVAAVAHVDPYPFYASLRDGPPLVWNERSSVWVASRADVIETMLQRHDVLHVRPAAEPVPRAIVGSPAGEVFGHLVRMNDGAPHTAQRPALERALAGLDLDAVHAQALRIAQGAVGLRWSDAVFELPIRTVAFLLGFGDAALPEVVQWMRDFVGALSPLSNAQELRSASAAATALMARFEVLASAQPAREASLLAAVCREAGSPGSPPSRALLCNLAGLLSQTCDATAGLLGNSLIALAREREGVDGTAWRAVVDETARHDPSVQNTRRFVASPVTLAGVSLTTDDAVLLVLASANRDPALNPEPDRFLLSRDGRRSLGFGHGAHACPGQALACTLAAAALEAVCTEHPERLRTLSSRGWRYRSSVNARIPDFQ